MHEGSIAAPVQLCRGLAEAHITSHDTCLRVLLLLICDLDLFVRRLL